MSVPYLREHRHHEKSLIIGAGEVNRTPDLLITNQLLYQLSYTGMEDLDDSETLAERSLSMEENIR